MREYNQNLDVLRSSCGPLRCIGFVPPHSYRTKRTKKIAGKHVDVKRDREAGGWFIKSEPGNRDRNALSLKRVKICHSYRAGNKRNISKGKYVANMERKNGAKLGGRGFQQ